MIILHKFYSSFCRTAKIWRMKSTDLKRQIFSKHPNAFITPWHSGNGAIQQNVTGTFPSVTSNQKRKITKNYFKELQLVWNDLIKTTGPYSNQQQVWLVPKLPIIKNKMFFTPTQVYTCTPSSISPKWLGTKTKNQHSAHSKNGRSREESNFCQSVPL